MTQSPLPKGQSGQLGRQKVDQASPSEPPDRPSEVGLTCRAGAWQGTSLIRAKEKMAAASKRCKPRKQTTRSNQPSCKKSTDHQTSRFYRTAGREQLLEVLAVAVAAAANVVPVAAWRQRTATETVTAGNPTGNSAKILGRRKRAAFGNRVRRRVATRARLRHRIRRRARRRSQHHAVWTTWRCSTWQGAGLLTICITC